MRKIKWGVLGTANIARGCTIPGMQLAENCELYAIAGRTPGKAEQFRAEFGFTKAYDSYEALLADPAVEAVYIPLPNTLHYEWVIKAAKAGKHILCEKPLAPNADQAAQMQSVARENHVFLMEAFAYLHSPLMAAIKAELDKGAIGAVRYLENATNARTTSRTPSSLQITTCPTSACAGKHWAAACTTWAAIASPRPFGCWESLKASAPSLIIPIKVWTD